VTPLVRASGLSCSAHTYSSINVNGAQPTNQPIAYPPLAVCLSVCARGQPLSPSARCIGARRRTFFTSSSLAAACQTETAVRDHFIKTCRRLVVRLPGGMLAAWVYVQHCGVSLPMDLAAACCRLEAAAAVRRRPSVRPSVRRLSDCLMFPSRHQSPVGRAWF